MCAGTLNFKLAIITLFPEMFRALHHSIVGRAIDQGLLDITYWNPRDYSPDTKHRRVDDRPYGGGPGMVLQVKPVFDAIQAAKRQLPQAKVLALSPQGQVLNQASIPRLAAQTQLILVAGRYEGMDERLFDLCIDEEWSIGDYVLTGGELPAMVLIDAISRLRPGVLGHAASAHDESFSQGLLDYPHYTRPEEMNGKRVPNILLCGDHNAIHRWRLKQSLGRTWMRRPELLAHRPLNDEESLLLAEFISETKT